MSQQASSSSSSSIHIPDRVHTENWRNEAREVMSKYKAELTITFDDLCRMIDKAAPGGHWYYSVLRRSEDGELPQKELASSLKRKVCLIITVVVFKVLSCQFPDDARLASVCDFHLTLPLSYRAFWDTLMRHELTFLLQEVRLYRNNAHEETRISLDLTPDRGFDYLCEGASLYRQRYVHILEEMRLCLLALPSAATLVNCLQQCLGSLVKKKKHVNFARRFGAFLGERRGLWEELLWLRISQASLGITYSGQVAHCSRAPSVSSSGASTRAHMLTKLELINDDSQTTVPREEQPSREKKRFRVANDGFIEPRDSKPSPAKSSRAEDLHSCCTERRSDSDERDEEGHICVIHSGRCKNPQVSTVCGHVCCKSCWATWLKTKENCPLCKTKVRDVNLVDLKFG